MHGGLAQGIAQALFEEAVYDDAGNLTTGTFVDYTLPTAADLPHFTTDRNETAVDLQRPRREGRRRGGHHRVHAGRHQRRGRRAAAVRRQRHPHAGHAGAGLAGHPRGRGRRQSDRAAEGTNAYGGASTSTTDGSSDGELAVIPAAFDYVRPDSVADAVSALADAGDDGKVLAGGQSLIPVLRLRLAYPSTVVDVGRIADLKGVRDDGDAIVIGAMTTHAAIIDDPLVKQHAPLIAQATETVADPQVRHRGTFGGALAHADPAGDLGAVALALDASSSSPGRPASGGSRPASSSRTT